MFKEGCEEVKDDSRSGRLSTNRTEVKVKRLSQMMNGDRQLTIRTIASQLDMKKNK